MNPFEEEEEQQQQQQQQQGYGYSFQQQQPPPASATPAGLWNDNASNGAGMVMQGRYSVPAALPAFNASSSFEQSSTGAGFQNHANSPGSAGNPFDGGYGTSQPFSQYGGNYSSSQSFSEGNRNHQAHGQQQYHQHYQTPGNPFGEESNKNYFSQPNQRMSMPATALSKDILNDFDPLSSISAGLNEVTVSSVSSKLNALVGKGLLSRREYQALQTFTARQPTRVDSALNKLEQFDDRSSVLDITQEFLGEVQSARLARSLSQQHYLGRQVMSSSSKAFKEGEKDDLSNSDSDDSDGDAPARTSGDTIVDSEEEAMQDYKLAQRLQRQFGSETILTQAPHPVAGGYQKPLPSVYVMVNGELLGQILIRVSSKKLFRKWKPMFFKIDRDRISLYDSNVDYESGAVPRILYEIHACMYIRKPTLKQTYSIMDDGRQVFFTTFRENEFTKDTLGYGASSATQTKYSFDEKNRRICKFGAPSMEEIDAFAHAVHSVILLKRKEKINQIAGGGGVQGRYNP